MDEEETKTDNIIYSTMVQGDKKMLDLMEIVWGDMILYRLAIDLGMMSEKEKEGILNEIRE